MESYRDWKIGLQTSKFKILVCLVLFVAVCGLACRKKAPPETDANAVEPGPGKIGAPMDVNAVDTKVPTEPAKSQIAVTVNGVDIAESVVEAQAKAEVEKMGARAKQLPPAFVEQFKNQIRQRILDRKITELLLDEAVKEAKIALTEEEVSDHITKIISAQRPPLSLEQFKAQVEAQGQSFEQVKHEIRRGLAYQKLVEAQFAGKTNVTVEDANQYYIANRRRYETPEQVRASHILIKPDLTDPNTDPNEARAIAKVKSQDLLKQIKEGADFAELAKANSACESAGRGGDLGFFGRGRMVSAFDKAVFELEVGKISDVVETKEHGYHIIKVTDHKDASVVPFDEVKENIINELTSRKKSEIANQYIESLKAKANIVYPPGKEPKPSSSPVGPVPSGPERPVRPPR